MSDASDSLSLSLVIYSAVKPIFKIYFIIALGFMLAKRNILTVTTCRDISDTIVTVIMPCLIFNNMVSYLKSSDIKNVGIIIFTAILLFLVGGLLGYTTHLVTRSPKRWLGGIISVGIFPNISDLPIAYMQTFSKGGKIFTTTEGNTGVAYICIFLMGMTLFQFTFGLYRLIEWDFRDELLKAEDVEKTISSSSLGEKINEGNEEHNRRNRNQHSHDNNEHEQEHEHSHSHNDNNKDMLETQPTRSRDQPRPIVERAGESSRSLAVLSTTDLESISSEVSAKQAKRNNQPPNRTEIENEEEQRQHEQFLKARAKRHINSESHESTPIIRTPSLYSSSSRRHRGSIGSLTENPYGLELIHSRNSDLRRQPSQNVDDVINEYSEFDQLRNIELEKSKSLHNDEESQNEVAHIESKFRLYARKMLHNILQPTSVSLLASIAICMSPPLKALFVPTTFYMPNAPDGQPPLSFVIDLASYIGAASVPLGLLLLGATLARLQVKKLVPGFWKTALMITAARLIIIPIFGVGVTTGMHKGGWYGSDKLVRFVSVLEFGLPNATSLVYFTAFYTDPTSDEHLQMDCLAVCLISQYLILWFTLPFLITFTMKVSMGL